VLVLDGIQVRYGDTLALDRVELTVADHEVVCVLGPSGCGKSTLLRVIAGLEPPAAGTVTWDGRDLAPVAPHRRQFGLMFQDHALFPHRDVLGNVAFGVRMHGASRTEVDTRARTALARVGLTGFEHRRVGELSGGEQQRVALARALAPDPRLLMLDEPLGSLDRELRERLAVELRALFVELGVTAIFVTHDQDEAFALADRVVVMRSGRIEQLGAPADVWRRPASEFVARFLGFATVVDATVDGDIVHSPWGLLATADLVGGRDAIGSTPTVVRLAARPETLRLTDAGPVRGVVATTTFRRDHFLVRVDTEFGPFDVAADEGPAVGTVTSVGLDPTGLVVLAT
jgi:thiamine transport system ATP-binding protein